MNIRHKLSRTLVQLADLLGVSRSLVNLYEIGKRNLPKVAWQKLIQKEMEIKNAEGKSAPVIALLFAETGLNRFLRKYSLKLQLKKLPKTLYTQGNRRLQGCPFKKLGVRSRAGLAIYSEKWNGYSVL
jgi:transcriptional regulator with XRE-family HTH domain